MNNLVKPGSASWNVHWIYSREEWLLFEKWTARRRGILNYLWHFLFHNNDDRTQTVELTGQWVKIGNKKKYFAGPVTALRRVDIYDKKKINIMNITYENLSKNQMNEITLPIPKGKLKEAIEVQEKLINP